MARLPGAAAGGLPGVGAGVVVLWLKTARRGVSTYQLISPLEVMHRRSQRHEALLERQVAALRDLQVQLL